jgi:RNA polymerase sigma factor for flagellar operon FliA
MTATQTRTQGEAVDTESLIITWMPLARSIATDFLARAPRHTDRDDIISAAFLGLVEAANRYDPSTGVPFNRWAPTRIRGAILDAARACDPLSKSTRKEIRELQAAEEALTQQHGTTHVGDEALAATLGWDVATIRAARAQFHRALSTSLDAVLDDAGEESFSVRLVDADPTPLETLERRELDRYTADAIATLPDRLREVVSAYYLRSEPSTVTAERLGLTPQRVGQLRREGLDMLKAGISAQYEQVRAQTATPSPAASSRPGTAARKAAQLASYAAALAGRSTFAERLSL